MRRFLRAFNTLYVRLIVSYIAIIIIVICIISLSFFKLSTKHYEKEITFLNNELLSQLRQSFDDSIIKKVERNIINTFLWDDSTKSKDFQDLLYLFDNPVKGNHGNIISARTYLQKIVSSQDDLIDSIVVFYKIDNLLVSSGGMKYLDNIPFEEILDKSSSFKDSTGFSWIAKDASDFKALNLNNDKEVVTIYCQYPFSGVSSNTKGALIINLKEDALLKAINSFSPGKLGEILIADTTGEVIIQTKMQTYSDTVFKEFDFKNNIKGLRDFKSFLLDIDNENVVVSVVPSTINNWVYIRIIPFEQYFSLSVVIKRLLIIICIATLLVGFIISNLFSFSTSRGIKKIIEISQNFFGIKSNSDNDYYNKIMKLNNSLLSITYNRDMFKSLFDNNLQIIRYNFLFDLINNRFQQKEKYDVFYKYLKMDTYFPYDAFNVILIEYRNAVDTVLLEKALIDKEYIKYRISEIISNEMSLRLKLEILNISTEQTAILINFDSSESSGIKELIEDTSNSVITAVSLRFTASIGLPCSSMEEIHTSFSDALQCMRYNFIYPEKCFFDYDKVKNWETINDGFPIKIFEDVNKKLRLSYAKDIVDLLTFIRVYIKENCISFNYCQHILIELTNIFARYIHDIYNASDKKLSKKINEEFSKLSNIDEFFNWITGIADEIESHSLAKKANHNQELVERIKEYIIKNIEKDLSLNVISEAFYINPFNLSKIYKAETGANLVDFISDLRIENSRELILFTRKSINEISTISGYSNASYFVKKFKEKYGCTPKQYRLEHAAGCDSI